MLVVGAKGSSRQVLLGCFALTVLLGCEPCNTASACSSQVCAYTGLTAHLCSLWDCGQHLPSCVSCWVQNWDISQREFGTHMTAEELAGWMLRLQEEGNCHNM